MVRFCETDKVKEIPLSINFLESLKGIMTSKNHLHRSHISNEIIEYVHSFCNAKVRENKYKITAIAHNLFRFDFFFLFKGLRAGVWRTRDLNIGGKNPTDINFANIGNQVLFIDTVKYFQQSLGVLANSLSDHEKPAISKECVRFLRNDEKLAQKFLFRTKEEQEWVLNYLSTLKDTIPYEMIIRYDYLDIKPENGEFFLHHQFYSILKDNILTDEEYENVRKFYQTMKLENLGELNKIYNFQDTIILREIFEQRSLHLQNHFKFNPRKCNSASSFKWLRS